MAIELTPPPGCAPFKQIPLASGIVLLKFSSDDRAYVTVQSEADALELEAEGWAREPLKIAKHAPNNIVRPNFGKAAPPPELRSLPEITTELKQAYEKWWSAAFDSIPARGIRKEVIHKAVTATHSAAEDLRKLLAELEDRLQHIADQPLPMGYSHVSKQFREEAQPDVDDLNLLAAVARLQERIK